MRETVSEKEEKKYLREFEKEKVYAEYEKR